VAEPVIGYHRSRWADQFLHHRPTGPWPLLCAGEGAQRRSARAGHPGHRARRPLVLRRDFGPSVALVGFRARATIGCRL
jgi:hypothetical protein